VLAAPSALHLARNSDPGKFVYILNFTISYITVSYTFGTSQFRVYPNSDIVKGGVKDMVACRSKKVGMFVIFRTGCNKYWVIYTHM